MVELEAAPEERSDDPLPGYLHESDLAVALGMHPRTLRRLDQTGDGPPRIRVGRRTFYRKEAVHQWLLERENAGHARTA